MTDDAVEVRDVVVRYGDTTAVNGVSLSLGSGRVLALLGSNGAGKTSLLQVCEGFRRPDGGTARVLGLDPIDDHDTLMPRLGIMLQSGGVYPWATAGEILVSSETLDGAGGTFRLSEPRLETLKGVEAPVEVVSVDWR